MLKFPVFKLLNEFIGEYLVGFSKDQMTLQFTEKTMTFNNLILNPKKVNEKLNSKYLFFHLKSGMIKDLKIEVISIMESKELKISIKELFLILGPNLSYLNPDPEEIPQNPKNDLEKLKKQAKEPKKSKISILKSLFLEKLLMKNKKNEKKAQINKEKVPPTDKEKLIFEVFKNIKISIEEFHLRYEDDQLTNPISFGLLIKEIQIFSSEINTLEDFNRKSQFVYLNLESKANNSNNKLGKNKNLIMKTLVLNKVTCYFNTKSELYIPYSLYENTKNSKKGIFEAINYFDLEYYMKLHFQEKDNKYLFKLFEIQGKLQIDFTLFSEDLSINPEENFYLLNLNSESISMNINREVIEGLTQLLEFYKNYDLLEALSHLKPRLKPIINCQDKAINHIIIKEWFELGIWYNRLIAYRDSQKLELIENSLLLSAHLNNDVNKRPQIMKVMNKLIDSPLHLAFYVNISFIKLQVFEEFLKILEIQITDPIFNFAINQSPNTMSFYIKTESLQIISLENEEFEPERYEIPFTIPVFDKNIHKKKIFEEKVPTINKEQTMASMILLKNGFNLTFVTSGIDIDGKTLDLKLNLRPIDLKLRHSGIIRLLNTLKNYLNIPYFNRKKPIIFLQKRIISLMDSIKNPLKPDAEKKKAPYNEAVEDHLPGFQKVLLQDISKEKNKVNIIEKSLIVDQTYIKYDLNDQIKSEGGEYQRKATHAKILYEELMILRAKAHKKQLREKTIDFKNDLKRTGIFVIIDYKEIEFKLERNLKISPIIVNFILPSGKISCALNQLQSEMNFFAFNGAKVEFSKDLDYLFDLLIKLI